MLSSLAVACVKSAADLRYFEYDTTVAPNSSAQIRMRAMPIGLRIVGSPCPRELSWSGESPVNWWEASGSWGVGCIAPSEAARHMPWSDCPPRVRAREDGEAVFALTLIGRYRRRVR